MEEHHKLVRNAAGRVFSEHTGAAFLSTTDCIGILRIRTSTKLPDAELEAILIDMAKGRGMEMVPDL